MDWGITAFFLIIVFLTSGHNFTCVPSVPQMLGRQLRPHWRGECAFGLLFLIGIISLANATSIPLQLHDLFFYGAMFWLMLAVTWADDKMRSLRRTVQFGIAAFTSMTVASAFDFDKRVAIIATCSGMFMLLELVDGAFKGRIVDEKTRRFGRTVLPNRQAINAFLAAISLTYFIETGQIPTTAGLALLLPTLFLLMLTQARAATWAGFLSFVVWMLASLLRQPDEVSWVILAMPFIYLLMIIIVFFLLVPKYPKATKVETIVHLGRKPAEVKDLNQRKPLWAYTIKKARKRWLVGHGYGSFWTPSRSQEAAKWEPVNAHSCYLDVFASTGLIGTILIGGFFVSLVITALSANAPEMQLILSLTCFVTLVAGMESKFWLGDYDTFAFLILVLKISPATASI